MVLKKLTGLRFLMLVLALVMVTIMPLSMASANDVASNTDDQVAQSVPGLSCPAGYTPLATYALYPGQLTNALIWPGATAERTYSLNLGAATVIEIVGWSAVGHPELGCPGGTNALCTAGDQLNEHFDIRINGVTKLYVPDLGDHQYSPFSANFGEYAAGTYEVKFIMPNNNNGNAPDPSVGYNVLFCGQAVPSNSCTYTQGWWRNHDWPVGDRNATFYSSGLTWYNAMVAQPRGDAYFILTQQYVAAYLNVQNGAPAPDALAQATAWFQTYGPGQRNNTDAGRTANTLAGLLDAFNNGFTGPGHCG